MNLTMSLYAFLLRTLLLSLMFVHSPHSAQGQETSFDGERLISSSAGLRLGTVYISVETDYPYHEAIKDRGFPAFSARGLRASMDVPYKQERPLLLLTLPTHKLDDCQSRQVFLLSKS